jgi:serine/threonine-protein kinase
MAMSGPPAHAGMAATSVTRPVSGPPPPRPPERKTSSWVLAVLAALGVLAVVALGVGLMLARNDDKDPGQQPAAQAQMPKITGLTEEDALARLSGQKFSNVKAGADVEDDDCPETPTVARQNPAPNTQIAVTEPVTYQLCKAPDLVKVPGDLVGSTEQAARQRLEGLGLRANIDSVDSDRPAGQVLEVEKSGQQVEPGETITVKTSRGNLNEVPDVTGRTEDTAKAVLSERGFNVNVKSVQQEGGVVGTVASQDPAGGEKRKKGTRVTITVIAEPDTDPTGEPDPSGTTTPPAGSGGDSGGGIFGG